MRLRLAGVSLKDIADQIGYASASSAHTAIKSAMGRVAYESAEDLLKVELQRLDEMQMRCWQALMNGDTGEVRNILAIMDKRHRLTGLDNPTSISITQNNTNVAVGKDVVVLGVGTSQGDYISALAAASGLTPEELVALTPTEAEMAPPLMLTATDDDLIEDAEVIEDETEEGME